MRKNLYTSILGQILRKGKRNIALNILDDSIISASLKSNLSISDMFHKISENLGSLIETKTLRLRRNVHVVPFPLNKNRRYYLISKKIIMSVKENKLKTSFKNKLIEEMYSILNDKESKSVNKKEYTLKEAAENKGNVHYRW